MEMILDKITKITDDLRPMLSVLHRVFRFAPFFPISR